MKNNHVDSLLKVRDWECTLAIVRDNCKGVILQKVILFNFLFQVLLQTFPEICLNGSKTKIKKEKMVIRAESTVP